MRGKDWPERKALRRLRGMKTSARHGFQDRAIGGFALQRVGNRQRGQGAVIAVDGGDHPVDQRRVDKRAHTVVDQCGVRVFALQRLQGEPGGLLPRRAAGYDGDFVGELSCGFLKQRTIVWMDRDDHSRNRGMIGKSLDCPVKHGPPADLAILFRPFVGPSGAFAASRRHDDSCNCFNLLVHVGDA